MRWMFSFSGWELRVTSYVAVFCNTTGPRIWYSNEPCPESSAVFFPQVDVLWNSSINPLQPQLCYRNNMPFPDLDGSGRFDPFALSFFMLSRYEEYTATTFDEHGRFSGHQAWGGPVGVRRPWADIWRSEVHAEIQHVFPAYKPAIEPSLRLMSIARSHFDTKECVAPWVESLLIYFD